MRYSLRILLVVVLALTGCAQGIPEEVLALKPESIEKRQIQTRRFDTGDEKFLLQSAAGVLQDLGYTIDESEVQLGVLVGSKRADATETGQMAISLLGAILQGVGNAYGGNTNSNNNTIPYDTEQLIRVSLITRPMNMNQTNLRITLQRIVVNSHGNISRIESVEDAEIYRDFFEKLSKSVFLTAHSI